jgi:hypothetical protein
MFAISQQSQHRIRAPACTEFGRLDTCDYCICDLELTDDGTDDDPGCWVGGTGTDGHRAGPSVWEKVQLTLKQRGCDAAEWPDEDE